jgi:dCTP deaminase
MTSGLLPDHEIHRLGSSLVAPFDPARVQPASYDLSLHPEILIPSVVSRAINLDLRRHDPSKMMERVSLLGDGYDIGPRGAVLASTAEVVSLTPDLVARVEGKSSLGRLFLAVHVTAGWIDPGWKGQVTLEIVNLGPWWVRLYAGMKIAQVNFTRLSSPCSVPYGSARRGSHYQGQEGPTAAVGKRGEG